MQHRKELEAGKEAEQAVRVALLTEELEAQRFGTERYFSKLLACSPEFRPVTHLVVLTCVQIGGLVASRFKLKYKRARPVQVWPVVRPLLPTPRHPSYPSGHALQCFLIAEVLGKTVPATAPQLARLALRIAVNRERAGVHFPSDTEASFGLAEKVATEMDKITMEFGAASKTFADLKAEIAAEWPGAVPGTPVEVVPPAPSG